MKHRITLLLVLVACASSVKTTTLTRANIGTKYARQTAYFAACAFECEQEETRGGIRHDVIIDEAVFVKADPSETCFDVTLRTEESKDEPLTELSASCEIDGKGTPAVIESEVISVRDYGYQGQQSVAVVEGVAATEYIGMAISRPAEKTFRVIERQGQVCCGRPVQRTAAVKFRNPHHDYNGTKGRLELVWTLGN